MNYGATLTVTRPDRRRVLPHYELFTSRPSPPSHVVPFHTLASQVMQAFSRTWVRRCNQQLFALAHARNPPARFPSFSERRAQHTFASSPSAPGPSASSSRSRRLSSWLAYPGSFLLLAGVSVVAYENYQPFRHAVLAVVRCSRIAGTSLRYSYKTEL